MRRFYLDRPRCVAQGVLFTDGTVAIHWLGRVGSTAIYPSLADFKSIHVEGHEGTSIRWRDKCCFRCGAGVDDGELFCCQCGATWSDGIAADEVDPTAGSWVAAVRIDADGGAK